MNNQKRTVLGALESSLETLRVMKSKMMDVGSPTHEMQWAIGSVISSLVANLLMICNTVIGDSMAVGDSDAESDLRAIQSQFHEFMSRMIGRE